MAGMFGKLSRWLRLNVRHPVELAERLVIAVRGRFNTGLMSRPRRIR